jgi:hypothetical protein
MLLLMLGQRGLSGVAGGAHVSDQALLGDQIETREIAQTGDGFREGACGSLEGRKQAGSLSALHAESLDSAGRRRVSASRDDF